MFDLDRLIIHEYSGQSGYGSLPYFVGKQYGSGWLRNIARVAFPFVRKALGFAGNVAANTAQDLIANENRNFGETLKEHAMKEAKRTLKRAGTSAPSSINRLGVSKKPKRNLIIK